jgi:hypothetical protein
MKPVVSAFNAWSWFANSFELLWFDHDDANMKLPAPFSPFSPLLFSALSQVSIEATMKNSRVA